jgi:hypothetical protein
LVYTISRINHHIEETTMAKLITKAEMTKLLKQGRSHDENHQPIIKLFNPYGDGTWLISEIDPEYPDQARLSLSTT